MNDYIEFEADEGIATILLNRPERKNAYLPAMGEGIVAALERAMADASVRVAILTGRGDAFCAGIDLDYLKAHMAGEAPTDGPRLGEEHLVNAWPLDLVGYPKPVIAAINGDAFGVGVTMTLGCDVRYVDESARLGLNFTALGVLPGLGSTYHLPRLVGSGKAMEWVLSGAVLSAQEACDAGLAQKLCAPGDCYGRARELALAMAGKEPAVLAAAKEALRSGAEDTLAGAIDTEKALSRRIGNRRKD